MRRRALRVATTLVLALGAAAARAEAPPDGATILADMRAAYAGLSRYADTGEVTLESKPIGATMITESFRFTTRFAAPKRFFFEFIEQGGAREHLAIWSDGQVFSTWWSATRVADTYPPGGGVTAFAVTDYPTSGVNLLVPALLFPAARMQSPLTTIETVDTVETAEIAGVPVYIVSGKVPVNHWGGAVQPLRVFVGRQDLLVRRIEIGTSSKLGADAVQRLTVIYAPQTDPTLDDAAFAFSPP